jgi:hypothetical protein
LVHITRSRRREGTTAAVALVAGSLLQVDEPVRLVAVAEETSFEGVAVEDEVSPSALWIKRLAVAFFAFDVVLVAVIDQSKATSWS